MKKSAVIFGDSYSTFEGYVPEGYAVYYSEEKHPETGVHQVEQTWWHQVVTEGAFQLVLNNSWSGSTIGYTGYNNADCSKTSSFICRLEKLIDEGFFAENHIDTAFVFGGTNDSWADVALGEPKFDHFAQSDLYLVLPAVCYFLKTVRQALPKADIYCLINTELKAEIAGTMEIACEKYGITKVVFEKIDKQGGHPTVKGMQDIKNTVLDVLNER